MIPQKTREALLVTRVGRLESLNGHKTLSGRLRLADGSSLICLFREQHESVLARAWLHQVSATGRLTTRTGRTPRLEVETIDLTEPGGKRLMSAASSFGEHKTLEQLAREQCVDTNKTWDEIAALWPVDDDPDEFLEWLLESRRQQRRLHEAKGR